MKSIIRWWQKQLDKLPMSHGLIRPGMWRVQYRKDNQITERMTYDAALNYAEAFNGEVIWVRYTDLVREGHERTNE